MFGCLHHEFGETITDRASTSAITELEGLLPRAMFWATCLAMHFARQIAQMFTLSNGMVWLRNKRESCLKSATPRVNDHVKTMDHRQRLLLKTILGLYYNDF